MRISRSTVRPRTCPPRMSPVLPAMAAFFLAALHTVPAVARVQTLGTAPPAAGTLSSPAGPRSVISKPVNSAPVTSRALGSSVLPPSASAAPTVVAGSPGGAAHASGSSPGVGRGAALPTFGAPRRSPAPTAATGIGTAALPFTEPVIDTRRQRIPLAPAPGED